MGITTPSPEAALAVAVRAKEVTRQYGEGDTAVAGVLAAVLPARRAGRLDILEALHYE